MGTPAPGIVGVGVEHEDPGKPLVQLVAAATALAARLGPLPQLPDRHERHAPGRTGQLGSQRAAEPMLDGTRSDIGVEHDVGHVLG